MTTAPLRDLFGASPLLPHPEPTSSAAPELSTAVPPELQWMLPPFSPLYRPLRSLFCLLFLLKPTLRQPLGMPCHRLPPRLPHPLRRLSLPHPPPSCLLLPAPLGPPDHPPPPRRPPPALRPLRRLFLPHPPPTRLLPAPLGPPAHQPPAILPPTLRPLRRLFHPRPPLSRLLPAPLRTPAHPPPAILPPTLRPLRPLRPLHRHFLLHPPPSRLPPPAPLETPAHQLRLLLQAHRLLHRPRYSASALSLTADFLRESLARASPNVAGLSTSTSATRTSPPSRSRRSKRPPASTPCHRSTAAAAPATPCHAASLQRSLRPLPFSLGGSTLSTPANPHCHSRQQSALQPPLLPSRTDLTFWRSI